MITTETDLYAVINGNRHLVYEDTSTILYFGVKEYEIVEDQEGDKYFMSGNVAIYIDGFKRIPKGWNEL